MLLNRYRAPGRPADGRARVELCLSPGAGGLPLFALRTIMPRRREVFLSRQSYYRFSAAWQQFSLPLSALCRACGAAASPPGYPVRATPRCSLARAARIGEPSAARFPEAYRIGRILHSVCRCILRARLPVHAEPLRDTGQPAPTRHDHGDAEGLSDDERQPRQAAGLACFIAPEQPRPVRRGLDDVPERGAHSPRSRGHWPCFCCCCFRLCCCRRRPNCLTDVWAPPPRQTRVPAPEPFKPQFVQMDGKCLSFKAFLKEDMPEAPEEGYRVRRFNIFYFLVDHTARPRRPPPTPAPQRRGAADTGGGMQMRISEDRQENSGLPQGGFLKRSRVPRLSPGTSVGVGAAGDAAPRTPRGGSARAEARGGVCRADVERDRDAVRDLGPDPPRRAAPRLRPPPHGAAPPNHSPCPLTARPSPTIPPRRPAPPRAPPAPASPARERGGRLWTATSTRGSFSRTRGSRSRRGTCCT